MAFPMRRYAHGSVKVVFSKKIQMAKQCRRCIVKSADFGNLCSECRHLQGLEVVAKRYGEEAGQMRFINKDRT